MTKPIKVVTIGDIDRGERFCDCGKPQKVRARGPIKMKLGLKGFGKHCVVDDQDQVVRCFRSKTTAQKVARGFGPGFRVKTG